MPAPSPVLTSLPLAPRWSRFLRIWMPCLTIGVRFAALDVHDEADAAGVMLELRVVEALLRRGAQVESRSFSFLQTQTRGAQLPRAMGSRAHNFHLFQLVTSGGAAARALTSQSDIYGVRSYRPDARRSMTAWANSPYLQPSVAENGGEHDRHAEEEQAVELARLAEEQHRDRDGVHAAPG